MSKVKTIIDGSLFGELSILDNPHSTGCTTKESLQQYQDDARAIVIAHGYTHSESYIIDRKKIRGNTVNTKVYYTESNFDHFFKLLSNKKIELSYERFTKSGQTEDVIDIVNGAEGIKKSINHTIKEDDDIKEDEVLPEW